MAVSNVAARRAAFNGVRAFSPCNHVSNDVTGRCNAGPCKAAPCFLSRFCLCDGFSCLVTRFAVTVHLAAWRGSHRARCFHHALMHDPAVLSVFLRHGPRAHRLMATGFSGLERLAQLCLFCEELMSVIPAA